MFQFPYPLKTPFNDEYTWFNYMLHCRSDIAFSKDRKLLFEDYYKDHIVEWEGLCTVIGENEIKLKMNPTDTTISSPDVTLIYNPKNSYFFPEIFIKNEKCRFRAKIIDFGSRVSNHKLEAVPMNDMKVDFEIGWDEFVFLFGAKARNYPDLLYEKIWKSLPNKNINFIFFFKLEQLIVLSGWCEFIKDKKEYTEASFFLHKFFVVPPSETIKLTIPKDKEKPFLESSICCFVTFKGRCMGRKGRFSPHTFEVVEVLDLPTDPRKLEKVGSKRVVLCVNVCVML
jgi:hypothetical protein